jgi:hypothetical protein
MDKRSYKDRKEYLETPKGVLMIIYKNMSNRVKGKSTSKPWLYRGLPLLEREEFYDWALNRSNFMELYNFWVNSGKNNAFKPSIDRIDGKQGYTLENMQWLTCSENYAKAGRS